MLDFVSQTHRITDEAPKSWTPLSYNWFLGEKPKFYCVFLKVRAPGAVICSNLESSLAHPVAAQDHRPSTNTARTPSMLALFGE